MVISHEDTFWNDRDDTKDLTDNPLYKLKTEYILKNDMVVWRDHDHMHAMKPDFTVVGELRSVGIKGGENAVHGAAHSAPFRRRRWESSPRKSNGRAAPRAFRCVGDPESQSQQDPGRPRIRHAAHDARSRRRHRRRTAGSRRRLRQRRIRDGRRFSGHARRASSCSATSFPSRRAWRISPTGCGRSSTIFRSNSCRRENHIGNSECTAEAQRDAEELKAIASPATQTQCSSSKSCRRIHPARRQPAARRERIASGTPPAAHTPGHSTS